ARRGLAQALDPDVPLGGSRAQAVSAAADESLPMGERMLVGVRELVDAPLEPGAAQALAARAQAARQRASELYWGRVDEEALMAGRMQASGTVRGTHGALEGTDGAAVAAANFRRADDLVADWARSGEPLTLERIQELNRVLGQGLEHNGLAPGALRTAGQDVFAGVPTRAYIPGENVAEAMDEFFTWYRAAEASGMEPIELAARTYQRLVSVHPFADANGRTSRMVMDYVLRSHGLPPATMENVNVAVFGYERALGIEGLSATPTQAVERVTAGVERSLELLGR
ncbi:MAG: Fic family protein, partial [Planctomycetes bacterium]|nr:Fic family protein [Planctomycetota bacterium]